jgi:hypothetical protein
LRGLLKGAIMKRKYAWIAIGLALWTGTAQGQAPYGGYPGVAYPAPPTPPYAMPPGGPFGVPYGPMLPTAPYPPQAPYGPPPPYGPTPVPMDPRLPVGAKPGLPQYSNDGPKPGASEPYLVTPDSGKRQSLPDIKSDERTRLIDFFAGPNEPYTTYEGKR